MEVARTTGGLRKIYSVTDAFTDTLNRATIYVNNETNMSMRQARQRLDGVKLFDPLPFADLYKNMRVDEERIKNNLIGLGLSDSEATDKVVTSMRDTAIKSKYAFPTISVNYLFDESADMSGFNTGWNSTIIQNRIGHNLKKMQELDPERFRRWVSENRDQLIMLDDYRSQASQGKNNFAMMLGGNFAQYTAGAVDNYRLFFRDTSLFDSIAVGAAGGIGAGIAAAVGGAAALPAIVLAGIGAGMMLNGYIMGRNSSFAQMVTTSARIKPDLTVEDLAQMSWRANVVGGAAAVMEAIFTAVGMGVGGVVAKSAFKAAELLPIPAFLKSITSSIIKAPLSTGIAKSATGIVANQLNEYAQELVEDKLTNRAIYKSAVQGEKKEDLNQDVLRSGKILTYKQAVKTLGEGTADFMKANDLTYSTIKNVPFFETILLGAINTVAIGGVTAGIGAGLGAVSGTNRAYDAMTPAQKAAHQAVAGVVNELKKARENGTITLQEETATSVERVAAMFGSEERPPELLRSTWDKMTAQEKDSMNAVLCPK